MAAARSPCATALRPLREPGQGQRDAAQGQGPGVGDAGGGGGADRRDARPRAAAARSPRARRRQRRKPPRRSRRRKKAAAEERSSPRHCASRLPGTRQGRARTPPREDGSPASDRGRIQDRGDFRPTPRRHSAITSTKTPTARQARDRQGFSLKGDDRVWLKDMLRDLQDEGLLDKERKRLTRAGSAAACRGARNLLPRRRRRAAGRPSRVERAIGDAAGRRSRQPASRQRPGAGRRRPRAGKDRSRPTRRRPGLYRPRHEDLREAHATPCSACSARRRRRAASSRSSGASPRLKSSREDPQRRQGRRSRRGREGALRPLWPAARQRHLDRRLADQRKGGLDDRHPRA